MAKRSGSRQQFQRTDRISEVVRHVVAHELERLDDDRLEMVTVTAVEVDNELATARVYYSALLAEEAGRLDEVAEALDELVWRVQKAVNAAVRARKTPQISFHIDDVLRSAIHLDDVIAGRVESAAFDEDV